MLSFDSLALLIEMDKLIRITKTKKLADAGLFCAVGSSIELLNELRRVAKLGWVKRRTN
jgi:hypothetical protein